MTIKNLMLECPHGFMHDQFCVKFPNHHCCMCVMEIMWDIPLSLNHWPNQHPGIYHVQSFYKPWAKLPTHHKPRPRVRMSILALGRKQKKRKRKFPIKNLKKAKKEIPNQRLEESRKERKIPNRRSEENKRNIQKSLRTKQYLNNTELSQANKKRKETTT